MLSVHDALDTVSVNSRGIVRLDDSELLGVRDGIVGTTEGGRLISLAAGTSGIAMDRTEGLLETLSTIAVDSEAGDGRLEGRDLTDGTGWKGRRTLDGTGLGGGRDTGIGLGGGLWNTTLLGALGRLGSLDSDTVGKLDTLVPLDTSGELAIGTVKGRLEIDGGYVETDGADWVEID